MTKHTVTISFEVPETVTRTELREFILDALGSWGGQRHPADHLFSSLAKIKLRFLGRAPHVSRTAINNYQRMLDAEMNDLR